MVIYILTHLMQYLLGALKCDSPGTRNLVCYQSKLGKIDVTLSLVVDGVYP